MFAVQYDRFGPPEVLSVGPFPEPHAGRKEVRVRVVAAGISPVDGLLRAGGSPFAAKLALPHVPGVDAAGVVDEVGAEVAGVAVGDEVFGTVDITRLGGASAEYAVLAFWARKPAAMSWAAAAAGGSSIETATRVLDLLDLRPGLTLLIDGAAGGVGSVAVQLALARGVHVIGTAGPANQDFLAGLGATPTTYGPGLPDRVAAADRALDVAGKGSLAELVQLTGAPAAVVTIADFTAAQHGVRLSSGEPTGRHGLAVAAGLFEEGRFHVPVQRVFAFGDAARAHAFLASGPRRGKLVLENQ
jgi:NADPH:quinone reductase-like Zn-dependent oxidoreductase